MPKAVEQKYFTFNAGLNTEAGFLNFPENTWADGDNITPNLDGSVSRRLKMDFESDYILFPLVATSQSSENNVAFSSGVWRSVAGRASLSFGVAQIGSTLYYFGLSQDSTTGDRKGFTTNLSLYKPTGSTLLTGSEQVSFVNANGKLIVVGKDVEPLLISYDADTDTIEEEAITLQIRDLEGVDDALAVSTVPTTISVLHNYNLLNQGWPVAHINTYFSSTGTYPSNAQIWTLGKDSSDAFSVALLVKQDFGTTPAPRGRFVLNLFNRDRQTASGLLSGIETEVESTRPTTSAFFGGRVWYAGMQSATIGSWVLFSQVANSDDKYGKCYQDADPSSEHITDLIATDGGVIPIQDAGTIIKLLPLSGSLLVLADNGIWQITGGTAGFSADAFDVSKISSVGCLSAKSVVEVENTAMFWAQNGIYTFQVDVNSITGNLQVISITDLSIQTLYKDIPNYGKFFSVGTYDTNNKRVVWLYNGADVENSSIRRFKKTRALIFDVRLKCFYPYSFSDVEDPSPYIADILHGESRREIDTTYNVVVAGEQVVIGDESIVATIAIEGGVVDVLQYLSVVPDGNDEWLFTFSDMDATENAPTKFKDWYSYDGVGVNYSSYLLTGYLFPASDASKKQQLLYLTSYMKRTETGVTATGTLINPSSCTLQSRWDWTDATIAGKWDAGQEVYRRNRFLAMTLPSSTFVDGYPLVVAKSKVRGRGRCVQLKWTADEDKDMQIAGWSIIYLGNINV